MPENYANIIEKASAEFTKDESFIVNYFDDEGKDYDEEFNTFEEAIEGLRQQWSNYETFNGGSFNNLMAEPTLSHPDGSGKLWNYDLSKWE